MLFMRRRKFKNRTPLPISLGRLIKHIKHILKVLRNSHSKNMDQQQQQAKKACEVVPELPLNNLVVVKVCLLLVKYHPRKRKVLNPTVASNQAQE